MKPAPVANKMLVVHRAVNIKEVRKVDKLKIGKIDVDEYFKSWPAGPLKEETDINTLLLRLTVIVNSMADRINEGDWDRLHGIMKRTEERMAKLESMAAGNVERGPGG